MNQIFKFSSKADTLNKIKNKLRKSVVPDFLIIKFDEWIKDEKKILDVIYKKFKSNKVIVRSSVDGEDDIENSYAGFFESVAKVSSEDRGELKLAINKVFKSYKKKSEVAVKSSKLIVQLMIEDVSMSGVIFTKDINNGIDYYVINYDDESGRTDTVTAGTDYNNRSLYIHRNATKSLRSQRFIKLIKAVKEIEGIIKINDLDIEFATDSLDNVFIFQIRPITNKKNWNKSLSDKLNSQLNLIQDFVEKKTGKLNKVFGKKGILGQMPDWNPIELIGRAPKKLALSLYRYLITDEIWRIARAEMGYKNIIGMPLMVTLSGVPYIDCRLSFNSFLPKDLPEKISEKLVNAWIQKLEKNQHYHDKVEFEIVIGEYCFDFDNRVKEQFQTYYRKEN